MRADRLVAILLLLQRREQVTAAEVAEELEVSERTARRDLDALAVAGIPIYSVQGRGGGWRLAGGGRTDLSGLTAEEARALFLVAGPHAGATKEVRAALRKLLRALPEPLRDDAEAASAALVVDPDPWDRRRPSLAPPALLDEVQRAVVEGRQADLGYVDRAGTASTRRVHPLGVATKANGWYLLADTERGLRTFRVDRMASFTAVDEPVSRPDGFELADAWQSVLARVDELRTPVRVRATADPEALPYLRYVLADRVLVGQADAEGRVEVEVRGHGERALAAELAGFGALLEVHEPAGLRALLGTIGQELAERYA